MKTKDQEKFQEPSFKDGVFVIPATSLSYEEIKPYIKSLQALAKHNCNVATVSPVMVQSLFDSVNNPDVLTIYINEDSDYRDIRAALKVEKDTFISLLEALMEYYNDRESLNIIIKKKVLRNHGDMFIRFTAQFAQQVAARTQEFLKVKVIYDSEKFLLGIFCRKSEFDVSVTFFGQLVYMLEEKGEAFSPYMDMPDTYQAYPSMLHFKLKKKLTNLDIKMQKLKTGLRFYFKKEQKDV